MTSVEREIDSLKNRLVALLYDIPRAQEAVRRTRNEHDKAVRKLSRLTAQRVAIIAAIQELEPTWKPDKV